MNRKEMKQTIEFAINFPAENKLKKNPEYLKREEFWRSFLKLLREDVNKRVVSEDEHNEIVASLLASRDWLSGRDALTGLPNRAFYNETINREVADVRHNKSQYLSILVIDVDGLKKINDEGHHFGDLAIILTARRIEESIRRGDLAARWGGDEFVVILPKSDLSGAKKVSEHILETINGEEFSTPLHKKLSVSIGIAEYDKNGGKDGESVEKFFIRADNAAIEAKNAEEKIVVANLENG